MTYDLEDSVSRDSKDAARENLLQHLRSPSGGRPKFIREVAARTNPVQTAQGMHDLAALAALPQVDAILVPKVDSAEHLLQAASELLRLDSARRHAFEALLDDDSKNTKKQGANSSSSSSVESTAAAPKYRQMTLIALIESARAVEDLREICTSLSTTRTANGEPTGPLLTGLVFGAEDFARDLGMTRTPSMAEFQYARSRLVTAAGAYGVPNVIDLVCTAYKEPARLEEECRNGRSMGFGGKQVIHPAQLEMVNSVFGVSAGEAEWAARIVVANAKAEAQGRGAWAMDGQMIDAPVIGRAEGIIQRARGCEVDVDDLLEKWQDQSPE